jgi:AcrR family transcriptional regulator/DNA-binding MarR family transcriptional regulator
MSGRYDETAPRRVASKRLSPRVRGVGHGGVSEIQRARILAAMIEAVAELGTANVTVAHVVGRCGVSRRTFYETFAGCEACFIAAFDRVVEQLTGRVQSAVAQEDPWRNRMRASLNAVLEYIEDEPSAGRLVIVEALGAGHAVLQRRQAIVDRAVAAVDRGREESKRSEGPPRLTAEGTVGAVLAVIHARIAAERQLPLIELLNPLMSMIVHPYLGPAAARRELDRPKPKVRQRAVSRSGNPFGGLEMRVTYRTVRVVLTIGSHPGVSNRRVAEEAGVVDQGQISKLLARLERVGLIENRGVGLARGGSNSWYLTERGREVEIAIREQTDREQASRG